MGSWLIHFLPAAKRSRPLRQPPPYRWSPRVGASPRRRPRRPLGPLRQTRSRCSTALPTTSFGCRRRARPRWASTPAREPRFDRSSPIARRRGSRGLRRRCAPTSTRERLQCDRRSRTPRAPASRWCAAPMRRRSKASRSRTATSLWAAGATRRMSSSRTSAPISTFRVSSIAIIASRTRLTPRRTSRGCSRTRSSSMASLAALQAARGAGLVPPAFLIDKAIGADAACRLKNAREGGTVVESIDAAGENHPGQLGRARAHHRDAGNRARARTAITGAAGPARGRHQRRRHLGASARRGILPLGTQSLDHDEHVAGRGPRVGPARAETAACADGRDPQRDRLHAGQRGRTDARRSRRIHATSSPKATRVAPRSWRSSTIACTWIRRRCRARSTSWSIRTWR